MDAFNHEEYIAKRDHKRKCDLCLEPIKKGQKCKRWIVTDGGTIHTCRVHQACSDEANQYDWYHDQDGWPEGALKEQRQENERG